MYTCLARIEDCTTKNAKLKLIRILEGGVLMPKQRWKTDKILAIMVYFMRKLMPIRNLSSLQAVCMPKNTWRIRPVSKRPMAKSFNTGNPRYHPRITRQTRDGKALWLEIHKLCQTSCFGTATDKKEGVFGKSSLDNIVNTATETAPFINSSRVFSIL